MKKIKAGAVYFTAAFLLLANSLFALNPLSTGAGNEPSDFKLLDLTGKQIALSDFKGKPVILFFWTTWCPFCREEISLLQNEYRNITAGGITLLAIDVGEPQEKVQKFLKNRNTEFNILLDIDSKVAHSYNLIGVPTFVLIDAQGKIRFKGNSFPDNYLSILQENRLRR